MKRARLITDKIRWAALNLITKCVTLCGVGGAT